jgi:hypothetical protein
MKGDSGYSGSRQQHLSNLDMLRRSIDVRCAPLQRLLRPMINVILALVPLLFATGSLVWLMTSGAQAQARSDAWAAQWMRDNG